LAIVFLLGPQLVASLPNALQRTNSHPPHACILIHDDVHEFAGPLLGDGGGVNHDNGARRDKDASDAFASQWLQHPGHQLQDPGEEEGEEECNMQEGASDYYEGQDVVEAHPSLFRVESFSV